MFTSKTTSRRTSALAAVIAALLLCVAAPSTALAGEVIEKAKNYDAEHQVVSDEVLDVLGLDVEHTMVFGARLPAVGSGRIRDALSVGELKNTLMDILKQNAEELLMPFEREAHTFHGRATDKANIPSAVAIAVTLGDRDVAEAWHPLGIEWLGLDEISVVFAFEAGSPWLDMKLFKLKGEAGVDHGGVKIALTGSFYVGNQRFTAAVMIDQEIDFVGRLRATKTGRRVEAKTQPAPLETNSTQAVHSTSSTRGHERYGPERKPKNAPALPPKTKVDQDDGVVEKGTKAKRGNEKRNHNEGTGLTLALLTETIDPRTLLELLRMMGVDAPLPDVFDSPVLSLRSVMAAIQLDLGQLRNPSKLFSGFSLTGTVDLFDGRLSPQVLLSVRRPARPDHMVGTSVTRQQRWVSFFGVRLEEVELQDVIRKLEGTIVGDAWLPSIGLIYSRGEITMRASDLGPAELAFFDDLLVPYGGAWDTNYTVKLTPGLNLKGPLPLSFLPQTAMRALGIVKDAKQKLDGKSAKGDARSLDVPYVILEGNPGISLGLGGSAPSLADMQLRATLPPISPERGPKFFVKGELYVEITGVPSVGIGGAITLDMDGDLIELFVEGSFAREGAGVSLALTGGMVAEQPWVAPFGIEWLTLNELVGKIAINVNGNLSVGFRADMMIGSKVIDTAMLVSINVYSGVPSNFMIEGRTNKLALADIAALQQKMASAVGRSPKLPISMLPNVELRDLYFRFAPRAEPDLGIEAGFGLAGSLWVEKGKSGVMDRIAEVKVEVGLAGIEVYGFVKGYSLGPITWDDAEIDLRLTLADQGFSIKGLATVVGKQMRLAVNLTPAGLLQDFMDAHGAAIGEAVDAAKAAVGAAADKAKAAVGDAKAQAKAAAAAAKKKLPTLRGRKKPVRKGWRR